MVDIGYTNILSITRFTDNGAYLDGEDLGEILLPKKFVDENLKVGDKIDVFVFCDSEDRLTATTQKPLAHVDSFAYLKVKQITRVGAFLDWGLDKDLLLPFREQKETLHEGDSVFVYLYLDESSNRIVASQKLTKFLSHEDPEYDEGERVDIFICDKTDIGYKVIVDNSHWGLIYNSELFRPVQQGLITYAFVKKVRDDNRIDVMLEKSSVKVVDNIEQVILQKIRDNGGFLAVTDKSSPQEIAELFSVSKKIYKKAVGYLYKNRFIDILPDGLKILPRKS